MKVAGKNPLITAALTAWLCLPWPAQALSDEVALRAWTALETRDSTVVRALPEKERAILKATLALQTNRPEQALSSLPEQFSDDPLVALLQAEAHRRKALQAVGRAGAYAQGLQAESEMLASANLSAGLNEADVRLRAFVDKLDGIYGDPLDLLALGSDVKSVFLVDKARSRMFVFERDQDGVFQRVADEYVVTGAKSGDKKIAGDARTPNGVYRFIKRLEGDGLPPRYGPVAFPIDYPNELDQLHHKNGHGIWMHGYANGVGRRPPRDTRGCFALPNPRLLAMAEHIYLGHSWVLVGEGFVFNRDEEKQARLQSVSDTLESWRSDWSSLDTDAYLAHYHPKFRSGKRGLSAWKRYKHRVNRNKSFIDVTFADMTIVRDPNAWPEGEVVIAEFDQHYRSSNYQDKSRKRLYLARANDHEPWRILIEEAVK
ncbi:MAG: murein L,D-transpeptidase family protein [Mariprofundaceae bacterium]